MTTPEPDPIGWIPNSEELEQFRKQLNKAIALDLGSFPTGEMPEIPTYYGPQAVALSTQNLNWLEPAFLDVLAVHVPHLDGKSVNCLGSQHGDFDHGHYVDWQAWREHVWEELRYRCDAAGR